MNVHKNAHLTFYGRALLVRRVVHEDLAVFAGGVGGGLFGTYWVQIAKTVRAGAREARSEAGVLTISRRDRRGDGATASDLYHFSYNYKAG
jgi:hypothetical protein